MTGEIMIPLKDEIVFSGFSILVGLMQLVTSFRELWQSRKSRQWDMTEGHILKSQWGPKGYAYIEYAFEVAGTGFMSNRIKIGNYFTYGWYTKAEKLLIGRYPAGKTVPVFYDRNNPIESVLEIGTSSMTYYKLFYGILMLLSGIWLWVNRNSFGRPLLMSTIIMVPAIIAANNSSSKVYRNMSGKLQEFYLGKNRVFNYAFIILCFTGMVLSFSLKGILLFSYFLSFIFYMMYESKKCSENNVE